MQNSKDISDEKLITIIRDDNKELYGEIINRYQNKLMRYVTFLIKDEDKAADVVQDAFIKAYINLNAFNTNKKFSSWIYRIVHNEAMNAVKKYHKEVPIIQDMDFSSNEDLEENVSKKEIVTMAHQCLDKMDPKYSQPLILFFIEEYSYEEISDILRIPMGTVAIRIKRAKAQMKLLCQKN